MEKYTIMMIWESCLLPHGNLINPDFMTCSLSLANQFFPFFALLHTFASFHHHSPIHLYRTDYFSRFSFWLSNSLVPSISPVSHFIFIMQVCLLSIHKHIHLKAQTYVKTHPYLLVSMHTPEDKTSFKKHSEEKCWNLHSSVFSLSYCLNCFILISYQVILC